MKGGGHEGENDDVIVATQTLAQLSVMGTHAEAVCFGYRRTNSTDLSEDPSFVSASHPVFHLLPDSIMETERKENEIFRSALTLHLELVSRRKKRAHL